MCHVSAETQREGRTIGCVRDRHGFGGVPGAVRGATGGTADPAESLEQASSAPHQRAVFISPPPHPGPRPGRGGPGGCRRPPFGLGGPPEPPVGAFRASFRRNLVEIWGFGGQKRLRNAREHTQETLGARRPWPPVDRGGVYGSRGRRRGQRARGCVRDRHGSGGVPKRLFSGACLPPICRLAARPDFI